MNDESTQKAIYKDEQTQAKLNEPLPDPTGLSDEDEEFLNMVMDLVEKGKIELHTPSSLINQDVYDELSDEIKGKADLEAFNLLAVIREVKDLIDSGNRETFQLQNSVQRFRLTKERIEKESGDIFII